MKKYIENQKKEKTEALLSSSISNTPIEVKPYNKSYISLVKMDSCCFLYSGACDGFITGNSKNKYFSCLTLLND